MSRYLASKHLAVAVLGVALGAAMVSTPASAQQRACPGGEGRTASGQCVNPGLSASLRHLSVRMNQILINQYIFPAPLAADGRAPRGFDVNRFENSQRGTGSTHHP